MRTDEQMRVPGGRLIGGLSDYLQENLPSSTVTEYQEARKNSLEETRLSSEAETRHRTEQQDRKLLEKQNKINWVRQRSEDQKKTLIIKCRWVESNTDILWTELRKGIKNLDQSELCTISMIERLNRLERLLRRQ